MCCPPSRSPALPAAPRPPPPSPGIPGLTALYTHPPRPPPPARRHAAVNIPALADYLRERRAKGNLYLVRPTGGGLTPRLLVAGRGSQGAQRSA